MKNRSLLHKLLSALLCLTLVVSLLPVSAFAEWEEEAMQPAASEQAVDEQPSEEFALFARDREEVFTKTHDITLEQLRDDDDDDDDDYELEVEIIDDDDIRHGSWSWSSSDPSVIDFEETDDDEAELKIVGSSDKPVTVTFTCTGKDGNTYIEIWNITVAAKPVDPTPTPQPTDKPEPKADSAMFYYLNDATANPADTGKSVWNYLGKGGINTADHDFAHDLIVDGDSGRVTSWPNGFEGGVVPKGTEAFKNILAVYNDSLKSSDIKENQIKEIKLVPYKLVHRNDGYHVDCTVVIEANSTNTVYFVLRQPDSSGFEFYDSFNVYNDTKIDGPSKGDPAEADGAAFEGWYADKECTVPADFKNPVNSNVTFYGKYAPKPVPVVSYVVKFIEQGKPANVLAEQITGSGKVGDTVAVGAVEITGYSLVSPASQTVDLKEGSNEIIFEYVRTGYKVNYLVDGKPYGEIVEYPYGTVVKLESAPTKEGYTFSGWGIDEGFVMPAHDVEITGSFAVNSYKLSYIVDGETVSEREVEYGEDVAIMDEPGREGYTFSGWSIDEDFAMPAHDVEISGSFALRTDLIYTVNYLEAGTNEPLAAPATVAAQTFGGRVTVSPIAIDGYTTPMAQSIVIDAGNNTVNFYYAAVSAIAAAPVVDIPQIAPAPETIDDEQTPLAAPVTVSVDEPVAITDEQTPLAGGEHLCCLLHFFILCAALVVELLYVSSMKKRQQDIFDKRRELSK